MTTGKGWGLLRRSVLLLKFLGSLIALVLVLILGTLFLAAGVYGLRNTSIHFEPLEATVLRTRPRVARSAIDTGSRDSWSVSVSLSYRYSIDGDSFPGQGTLVLGRASSPGEAERRVVAAGARFVPGRSVEVFVDPDNPARSVLRRRGVPWAMPALALGAAIFMILLGIAVMNLWAWLRRRTGAKIDNAVMDRRFQRWLTGVATVLLVTLLLAAVGMGLKR